MKLSKMLVALGAAALALTACGGDGSDSNNGTEAGPTVSSENVDVGIIQLVSHPALDAVAQGFEEEIEERGYADRITIDLQNAQADQGTLTAIANQFVQDDKDLIIAIATPSVQAAAQATADIPVLFSAVTDPVEAGVVDSWEAPGGNVSGVSDLSPVEEQLKLLLEIAPDVETVGIVYASGEVNSEVQVRAAEEAAEELGLTIRTATVANSSEVQQGAESLDVDAYFVPTDNVVVTGVEGLVQVAERKQIPVIGSDSGSIERGIIAAQTANYLQQGKDVADMAIQVLEGANPAEMPVQLQETFDLHVNPAAAERMGVVIPESVLERATTTY